MRVDGVTVPCVAGEYSTGLGTLILTASHDKSLPIRVMTSKGHIAQLVTRAKQAKGYKYLQAGVRRRATGKLNGGADGKDPGEFCYRTNPPFHLRIDPDWG